MNKKLEDFAADYFFKGEQLSMYFDAYTSAVEAYFPERPDINRPDKMIDAMLRMYVHEDWPDLSEDISQEIAEEIILSVAIADALHETLESFTPRFLDPHPTHETGMWQLLLDVGVDSARRLVAEYPQ